MGISEDDKTAVLGTVMVLIALIVVGGIIAGLMVGLPKYNVWHQHMKGKSELARAEYSRQIAVVESEARLKSSVNLAQADIERAKGTAEANHIIGTSLTENYLRWYFIDSQHSQRDKTYIYVPTEAMMPIMEAGRFNLQTSRRTTLNADSIRWANTFPLFRRGHTWQEAEAARIEKGDESR